MELKAKYIFLLYLLILLSPSLVIGEKYLLPEPDYRPEGTAKACLSGEITEVGDKYIIVKGLNTKKAETELKVLLIKETSILTVYGGYVAPGQLKNGIKLKVWFQGLSCDQPDSPISAVRIMIASKRPGDDWP